MAWVRLPFLHRMAIRLIRSIKLLTVAESGHRAKQFAIFLGFVNGAIRPMNKRVEDRRFGKTIRQNSQWPSVLSGSSNRTRFARLFGDCCTHGVLVWLQLYRVNRDLETPEKCASHSRQISFAWFPVNGRTLSGEMHDRLGLASPAERYGKSRDAAYAPRETLIDHANSKSISNPESGRGHASF